MKFATLHVKLLALETEPRNYLQMMELLRDAAIEGYAEDFEVIYSEKDSAITVSVPYLGDTALMEAGSVLGFCMSAIERAAYGCETWMTLREVADVAVPVPA